MNLQEKIQTTINELKDEFSVEVIIETLLDESFNGEPIIPKKPVLRENHRTSDVEQYLECLKFYDEELKIYNQKLKNFQENKEIYNKAIDEYIKKESGFNDIPTQYQDKVLLVANECSGDSYVEYYNMLKHLASIFQD